MNKRTNPLKNDIRLFLAVIMALILIGTLFIYSSSSVYALERFGSAHYFVKKHCIGLFLGFFALLAASLFPLELIRKLSPIAFWGSFLATITTLIPAWASPIHGSQRWLSIAHISIQPSEMLKLCAILYCASILAKKPLPGRSSYGFILGILGCSCLVLLLQPDFGMAVTLFSTGLFLCFISSLPLGYLLSIMLAIIPCGLLLIYWYPYRLQRILTFLNPWKDPQGAGFQIIQSLIAIGSGNWFGKGIAYSQQKFFYLPMQYTDFIFAIIAEETGFIGAAFLIFLYMVLVWVGIRITLQISGHTFAAYMTAGVFCLLNLQALINVAVATGLAPTKGMSLPFVSAGNSALLCNLIMVGLILNAARQRPFTLARF